VDLTGDWKNNVTARIRGGVGKATVRLPQDLGVRVHAEGGIGAINAHGFKRDGGAYVNDAYGKSDINLRVDVQGGVGEINLELADAPPVV
jgi:predicted membrane protein